MNESNTLRCVVICAISMLSSCGNANLSKSHNKQPAAKAGPIEQASGLRARCAELGVAKPLTVDYSGQRKSTTTHYNAPLATCFQLIGSTNNSGQQVITAMSLRDAFGGKEYGEFLMSLGPKDSVDTVPVLCRVAVSELDESCTTPEEFAALTKQYMER